MQARRIAAAGFALLLLFGCSRPAPAGSQRLVFKQQPLWGDPAPFTALLDQFRRAHPEVELVAELLPNASDVAHQFFLTSLAGGTTDYDVMAVDVIWVPELARAGWAADLTNWVPPAELEEHFLPGMVEAVLLDGRVHAVPWFADVGLLYYRSDLVPRAPRTFEELEQMARAAMARDPALAGYVWQGKQYEGLNCNVFEAIWAQGGRPLEGERLVLDTPETGRALEQLRSLIRKGISPPSTTTAAEEDARRLFTSGKAVFMRNWPYAWAEAQRPDSPVRGKVAFATLPTASGEPGSGTLGGWNLAVNAHQPAAKQALAAELIRHLTSEDAQLMMALKYARNPPRRAVYTSAALREGAPFIAELLPLVESARPRPVTPWYMLITDTLQGEFSAAIAGLREPRSALQRAQLAADHLMGVETR
jgi:multiple sugar transport system substrate-binding protein